MQTYTHQIRAVIVTHDRAQDNTISKVAEDVFHFIKLSFHLQQDKHTFSGHKHIGLQSNVNHMNCRLYALVSEGRLDAVAKNVKVDIKDEESHRLALTASSS